MKNKLQRNTKSCSKVYFHELDNSMQSLRLRFYKFICEEAEWRARKDDYFLLSLAQRIYPISGLFPRSPLSLLAHVRWKRSLRECKSCKVGLQLKR